MLDDIHRRERAERARRALDRLRDRHRAVHDAHKAEAPMKLKGPAMGGLFLIACILTSAYVGWSIGLIIRHVLGVLS